VWRTPAVQLAARRVEEPQNEGKAANAPCVASGGPPRGPAAPAAYV